MRKLPLFVLAAATALSIASVPMTAHAATIQVVGGGNGMNGYMTNCSGKYVKSAGRGYGQQRQLGLRSRSELSG